MTSVRLSVILKIAQGPSHGTLLDCYEDSTATEFRKHQIGGE